MAAPGGPTSSPAGWTRRLIRSAADGGRRAAPNGAAKLRSCRSMRNGRSRSQRHRGISLKKIHEFCGAGLDDPSARREFPLRALADTGRRNHHGIAAGIFGPKLPAWCSPNIIRANHDDAAADSSSRSDNSCACKGLRLPAAPYPRGAM
jgi:hypothetical protein